MTPAARLSAAIAVLDEVLGGAAAEQALTNWARASRYAGSGDRAAVRDHVYDALRCRRSHAALGGAETGRGLVLGGVLAAGGDPATLFTGARFAPPPLRPGELPGQSLEALPEPVRLDLPDWLVAPLRAALGPDFAAVAEAMRHRAPVFLRANLARTSRDEAAEMLARDGIGTRAGPGTETVLRVTENTRRIKGSQAFLQGLVEVQDAASQTICARIPLTGAARVLDYCAGGGGKALALAARGATLWAHDAAPRRMLDLSARAARAGVSIAQVSRPEAVALAPFDVVVTDVPCSGSGTWRRAPQAKWTLTPERLAELVATQAGILDEAASLVAPTGHLAYVTCSLLEAENNAQIAAFLTRHHDWRQLDELRLTPGGAGDGMYLGLLTR